MNPRACAAQTLFQVLDKGQSVTDALPVNASKLDNPKDKALLQELVFGCLRWFPRLDERVRSKLSKPLKGKFRPLHYLMLVGLYQLEYTRIPAHAALSETVNASRQLKGAQLSGMINGVLRNLQREQAQPPTPSSDAARYAHPQWLLTQLQNAYPEQWQQIVEANNQKPPMWIRINQHHCTTDDFLQQLQPAHSTDLDTQGAVLLETPCDATTLPGFSQGDCSVQDLAAQQAASILAPQAGERILDVCAAPGGKTGHLLEQSGGELDMVALDVDAKRLSRVSDNLQRLGYQAQVCCGDAAQPEQWWDGKPFDRILLDAPCSATGVIRRHPDIKWLRREQDIQQLSQLQYQILNAIWPLLKPGGQLLYATCSILPQENSQQIVKFLKEHSDVKRIPLDSSDSSEAPGWQILTGQRNMDGFFYALLEKTQ